MMYFGAPTPDTLPVSHSHDAFLDHLPTQMAITQAARRLSRGSTSQKSRPGMAMRVVRPSSANNSPRSSTTLMNRRRTMMADASTLPRQHQAGSIPSHGHDVAQPPKQSVRPLSWHPTSHMQHGQVQHQQHTPGYALATPSMYADHNDLYPLHAQSSPMMTSYSNNTSPSSTFSPLPLFPGGDNTQCMQADAWHVSQTTTPLYAPCNGGQGMSEPMPTRGGGANAQCTPATCALDWDALDALAMQGFNNTSPPTPESLPQMPHAHPVVSEAAVPYETLDETEDDGEILVGMGLYDAPDKFDEDPQLNNYRSTVSSLLGSPFRPLEPRGKGLKLEETWEPPKSDDGEEEENDGDEDDDDDDDKNEVTDKLQSNKN